MAEDYFKKKREGAAKNALNPGGGEEEVEVEETETVEEEMPAPDEAPMEADAGEVPPQVIEALEGLPVPALQAIRDKIDEIIAGKEGGDEMGAPEDMDAGGDMGAAPPHVAMPLGVTGATIEPSEEELREFLPWYLKAEEEGETRGQNARDWLEDMIPEIKEERADPEWIAEHERLLEDPDFVPTEERYPATEAAEAEHLNVSPRERLADALARMHAAFGMEDETPEEAEESQAFQSETWAALKRESAARRALAEDESAVTRAGKSNEQKRAALENAQEKAEIEQNLRLADLKHWSEWQPRSTGLGVPIGDIKPETLQPEPREYTSKGSMAPPTETPSQKAARIAMRKEEEED